MNMVNTIEMEAPVLNISTERKPRNNNSIDIENVTVSFKTPKGVYTAVKDISINVKKGEIISVKANSVVIEGLRLMHSGRSSINDFAAIKLYSANHVRIEGNRIVTVGPWDEMPGNSLRKEPAPLTPLISP